MARSNKARKSSVSRYKPWKGPRGSTKWEKKDWNHTVRAHGRRYCHDFYRKNEILFSGYPKEERVSEGVVYNRRPWID